MQNIFNCQISAIDKIFYEKRQQIRLHGLEWFHGIRGNLAKSERIQRGQKIIKGLPGKGYSATRGTSVGTNECSEEQQPMMCSIRVSCQDITGSKAWVGLWKNCKLGSRDYTISCSFTHLHIQHPFTKVLLCARHYSRCQGYTSKQDRNPCPNGVYNLEETDNKQDK